MAHKKDVYLICSVRWCTPEIRAKMDAYVKGLEDKGITVHYPPRDVMQNTPQHEIDGTEVCEEHIDVMLHAKEIHIWYVMDPKVKTEGTFFDFGMAYMMHRVLKHMGRRLVFKLANPHELPAVVNPDTYLKVLIDLEIQTYKGSFADTVGGKHAV
jgi:hypothetical protein